MISKGISNLNLVRSLHMVSTRGGQEDTLMAGRVYLLLVLIHHQAIRVWGIQVHTQQGPRDLF